MKRLPTTLSLARRAGGDAAPYGERLKFIFLFESIPRCLEGRDLRYASTSGGKFEFKTEYYKHR